MCKIPSTTDNLMLDLIETSLKILYTEHSKYSDLLNTIHHSYAISWQKTNMLLSFLFAVYLKKE